MKTRYEKIDPANPDPLRMRDAALILAEGGLVVFPTETVYGIGARWDLPDTVSRLRVLKGRSDEKAFTIHISDVDEAFNYVSDISPLAMRLIDRYWPGPLTMVLPARHGGAVGLRWPKHPVAQALLRQCNFPVIAPSVNPGGEAPALTADGARAYFDGKIDLVLDAGPCELQTSSTVLEVQGREWRLLRAGPIGEKEIKAETYVQVLFVCTGNTCRSPMAEGLCKKILSERLNCDIAELPARGYRVNSMGTSAINGGEATPESVAAMRKIGVDISGHVPSSLSLREIDTADRVYTMTHSHLDTILHWNPFAGKRARLLRRDNRPVQDPFGGPQSVYDMCARELRQEIEPVVEELLAIRQS